MVHSGVSGPVVNSDIKLDRWAERELERNRTKIILQDEQGTVLAFGGYAIVSHANGAQVIKYGEAVEIFTSRAAAMSWCVADQRNLVNLARKVRTLDLRKRMLSQDLDLRRAAAARSHNADFRERILTKITTKQSQLNSVKSELAELMSQAKYIQLQGSQHETSRTRRA
jgi:hypothetical protein